ncbi:hypothetical protein HID58_054948 [Brassica napus]|uniref:Uncharacterized protein n=1 Tax=Brassica napus TaxID=3708 RepID=A0ABQ8AJ26_BRANA|nr:hypothetical protein HID58_054948 [Brassica napus]
MSSDKAIGKGGEGEAGEFSQQESEGFRRRHAHAPAILAALRRDITMSSVEDAKEQGNLTSDAEKSMPSSQQEEAAVKSKYGGLMPKKPPLISKPTQQQTRYRKSPCAPSGEDGGAAQGE